MTRGANGLPLARQDPVDEINELKKEGYTSFLLWIHRKNEKLRSAVDGDAALVLEREFPNRTGSSVKLYSMKPVRQ